MAAAAPFQQFRKFILHPVRFRLFLLSKLPVAFFAGIRIISLSEQKAVVRIRQQWFNKNPFRSVYFGMLSIAAEVSTGIICMGTLYRSKPPVSMLIVQNEGSFLKKATGTILFTCEDGDQIKAAVRKAIETGEGNTVTCRSVATNEQGEIVAAFLFTWSFKAKQQ